MVDATQQRDFPMVQGVILCVAAMVVVTNLLLDVIYTVLDPRMKTQMAMA
jgi:peptide/nickel transport system permease protein